MAHDYAMALVLSPDFDDDMSLSAFVKHVWKYADKMQAEEDKRKVGGVPEVIKNSVTIYQVPQKDFTFNFDFVADQENWQPDWSQAPDGVTSWHMNENKSSYWVIGSGVHLFEDQGKFLVEGWCVRKPAPSFDYKGDWKESLRKRP